MQYKDTGFRVYYKNFCAIKLNKYLKGVISAFPDADKANCVLVYGYIKEGEGLLLELLAAGGRYKDQFHFFDAYTAESISLPVINVEDREIWYFEDADGELLKRFGSKLRKLEQIEASEEMEITRHVLSLDASRDPYDPDVVNVEFRRIGCISERHRVRLTAAKEDCLEGRLLEQPEQNFGAGIGDTVEIYTEETDEDAYICISEYTDDITPENIDNGSLLNRALSVFQRTQNEYDLLTVLRLLKNSSLYVPCHEHTDETGDNGFTPAVIKNNDEDFIPAFSSEDMIEENEKIAAHLKIPFEVLSMAVQEGKDLYGIVVNPFTEPFIISRDILQDMNELSPMIPEENKDLSEVKENSSAQEGIVLAVGKMDIFNYALYLNNIRPVRGITIANHTKDPVSGLRLKITSSSGILTEYETDLPEILPGRTLTLEDPVISVDVNRLAAMTETAVTGMQAVLMKDEEVISTVNAEMTVLAYDQWQGSLTYRDLLPVFVMPNHPVIAQLMHDTAERLKKWRKPASLEGYQSGSPNRVRELAAAAYAAVQKKNILYAEPPSSFTVIGQRIRTPEVIMEQRLGTCMDMTMLYASLLEAIGLDAVLVLLKGHIFAGVWLKERTHEELMSSDMIIENPRKLTTKFDNRYDEMTFAECTMMCSGDPHTFEEAEQTAKRTLKYKPDEFDFAIDVRLARIYNITPLPSRTKEGGSYQVEVRELRDADITSAPKELDIEIQDPSLAKTHKIMTKRELWESKLLDLTGRNMLLNLRTGSSVEPIMSAYVDELEDALADGHEFHLYPVPDWIMQIGVEDPETGKPVLWIHMMIKKAGILEITKWPVSSDFDFNEKFRQEYRSHRLYTFNPPKLLDKELTSIYRAARASQQENGVSSLYLAIGMLRWFPEEDSDPYYAPLILLPVEIVRKSANQGYALHARDEEPHFNATLLEMLKQSYNIEIQGLDPLPADDHGVNIKKVFAMVRRAVVALKNWDVVESCAVANLSFAQFAMWNDIHTAGELLDNSKVVKSLMQGHLTQDFAEPAYEKAEKTYLPITVDATQLEAVNLADTGNTFVLHGPPGTGKSQTITAMIANLMAHGRKVLFVAEKLAALTVVEKRLSQLGIGDFCLELHSDKANKKQVLTQLEKALSVKAPSVKTDYEGYYERARISREKLDDYASHLHQKQKCGYSLRELIDLYDTVMNCEREIFFDEDIVSAMTESDVRSHLSLIGQLTAAGSMIGNIREHPLRDIDITTYNAEFRNSLNSSLRDYRKSLNDAFSLSAEAAEILHFNKPENLEGLNRLISIADFCIASSENKEFYQDLLECDFNKLRQYCAMRDELDMQKQELLAVWKEDFLSADTDAYLEKLQSANRKFFGRANAVQNVMNEIASHAKVMIQENQIQSLFEQIRSYQKASAELDRYRSSLSDKETVITDRFSHEQDFTAVYGRAVVFKNEADTSYGSYEAFSQIRFNEEQLHTLESFKKAYERMQEDSMAVDLLLLRKDIPDNEQTPEKEASLCSYILSHGSDLKDWSLYNKARHEALKTGLKPVVDAYEAEGDRDLSDAYRKGLSKALINHIIDNDDVLSSFSGAAFNESVRQFKQLDDIMLDQTKQEIFNLLADHVPGPWDSTMASKELNLLRKAIGSNARGMSIRSLFERIPNVIYRLCPCMLMSPNSVAQYLPQANDLFDVVIFDEASQLPTCKSIGALYRAKNAVIVGDPKQMPPTSFFAGSGPEVDDLALEDLDSILDDALALGIPSRYLQWHYRSTHESLIAFSNNQFYQNRMYTFPSANDRESHVTSVHVDGIYTKGTNVKEAEAVVQEIIRRYRDPVLKKQSIGVVTFNVKQQALIENLLAKQYQKDPLMDVWANNTENPVFVKNLENVQGDERDVILFSIGYGPDEKGRISMNFGPINQQGGGKRLNVAFSRARITMTVFSSITSADLRITENSPEGLIAFRDFLKFAEGHELNTEEDTEKKRTEAGIMQNVCRSLKENGYQYETMIGHSDFRIDIAVIDPYDPSNYLLGIMLDGEGYKQTDNTRDREVAQIDVLKRLGWKLHRIWTIDWWDNRDREIRKLLAILSPLKTQSSVINAERIKEEEKKKEYDLAHKDEEEKLKEDLESLAAEVMAEEEDIDDSFMAEAVQETVTVKEEQKETTDTVKEKKEEAPVQEPEEEIKETAAVPEEEPVVSTPIKAVPAETEPVPVQTQINPAEELFEKLRAEGIEIINKLDKGGALWVIGGRELAPIMKQFREIGINFSYKQGGGRATENRDGWWTKSAVPSVSTPAEIKPVIPEPVSNKPITKPEPVRSMPAEKPAEIITEGPQEFIPAELSVTKISLTDLTAKDRKAEILERVNTVLNAEAPVLRDVLIRKLMASYGMRVTGTVQETAEKLLKTLKVKTTKQKGIIYCWAADQDPKTYTGFRTAGDRSNEEITPYEITNAMCYVLHEKGSLSKDDLLRETTFAFGYKRLTAKWKTILENNIKTARTSGRITVEDGMFKVVEE